MAHDWLLFLHVPVDCQIGSQISGLKVTPSALRAGVNELHLHTERLPRDFLIDGHLILHTPALRRRIAVTAYADESPASLRGQGQVIWAPLVESPPPAAEPSAPIIPPRSEPIAPIRAAPESSTGTAPVSSAPSPKAMPVHRPVGGKVPRLRRDQRPNALFADTNRPSIPTSQIATGESRPPRDQIPSQYFADTSKPIASKDQEFNVTHQNGLYAEDRKPATPKKSKSTSTIRQPLIGSLFDGKSGQSQENHTRRLPVYILLDTSKGMEGEPIAAIRQGIKALLADLRSDPQAIETGWLSLITFDHDARQLIPLTELMEFREPLLEASKKTGVALGKAIHILKSCLNRETNLPTNRYKGDWKALVVIFISENPTDNINDSILLFEKINDPVILSCGPEVDESICKILGGAMFRGEALQPDSLKAFFKWISVSLSLPSIGRVFSK